MAKKNSQVLNFTASGFLNPNFKNSKTLLSLPNKAHLVITCSYDILYGSWKKKISPT